MFLRTEITAFHKTNFSFVIVFVELTLLEQVSPSYTAGSKSLQKGNNNHNSPLQSDCHAPGRDHSTTLRTRYYFIPILQIRNRGTEKLSKGILTAREMRHVKQGNQFKSF